MGDSLYNCGVFLRNLLLGHLDRQAIFWIADNRMTNVGEVETNLVGTAGFEFAEAASQARGTNLMMRWPWFQFVIGSPAWLW